MSVEEEFEKVAKRAFMEIGVAPQRDTPAWRACKHMFLAGIEAGRADERKRCVEIAKQCAMSIPKSIGKQHGVHHSAGIQRVMNIIERQEGKS